jgi:hypothetical protein
MYSTNQINPTKPPQQPPCFVSPTSTTTSKNPGRTPQSGLEIPNSEPKNRASQFIFSDTDIDRRTTPDSAKELSPLAGSNRGPQDNE